MRTALAVFSLGVSLLCLAPRPARAQTAVVAEVTPAPAPRWFVQAGTGLAEVASLHVGRLVTPRLSIEAQAATLSVFGAKLGLGATYAFGRLQGQRPPRHALLVSARAMTGTDLAFTSHGDTLGSYAVAAIGYGFLAGNGFMLRVTAGPVLTSEREPGDSAGHLSLGGPFVQVTGGIAF